jgi:hypothetical protein
MAGRSLDELIDDVDSAWPLVQDWLDTGQTRYSILEPDPDLSQAVLLGLQVTTRSPLGALALHTGGIVFDQGWLRLLGGGSERMRANLLTFTEAGDSDADPLVGGLVVAHDAIGGFFAFNGGAFPGGQGDAYYLAPDTRRWEALNWSRSMRRSGGPGGRRKWAHFERMKCCPSILRCGPKGGR